MVIGLAYLLTGFISPVAYCEVVKPYGACGHCAFARKCIVAVQQEASRWDLEA